uniref:mitochondrial ubiquitin ligase activator of NFKB 1-like n=1 Tax=Myxine glutinosa TaxID=7769 RepID=UPI00358F7D7D
MDLQITPEEFLALGAASIITGFCYGIHKWIFATVKALREAPRYPPDKGLVKVLEEAPGKCLQHVIVEGIVVAAKEPLRSHFVPETSCVLKHVVVKEHWSIWNPFTHHWDDSQQIMHERKDSLLFVLFPHDDKLPLPVQICHPFKASELDLETSYQCFHPADKPTFISFVGQLLSGVRRKGILEIERILRPGAHLMAIGELSRENGLSGPLRLGPPSSPLPYILRFFDNETVIEEWEQKVRYWNMLRAFAGLALGLLLGWIGWRALRRWRAKRAMGKVFISEESIESPCVVCISSRRSCIFLDCGHICCCVSCADALPSRHCPICRAAISRTIQLFRP